MAIAGVLSREEAGEAILWDTAPGAAVVCRLCAHRCRIREGLRGICGVRENQGGDLVTRVHDLVVTSAVDPIEKKPFFHFLPGTAAYSIAAVGCNFHCRFCQNWAISQWPRQHPGQLPGMRSSPASIVAAAVAAGCRTIAYTYTEPTVFFELVLGTSRVAERAGLKNVVVTNGYMTSEALEVLAPVLHGANVDLKSFSDRFYRKICGARLEPVLETIRGLRAHGVWVEVTTLLVPGFNDSTPELTALARWLASVDPDMPWHVSAFSPAYRMTDVPPTPVETLHRAARIGREAGLAFVYTGNVPGDAWESTACPRCARWLVRRRGFERPALDVRDGRCPVCSQSIPGVWR